MSFNPGSGGGGGSIATSSDVTLTSPNTDQVLTYNGTAAKWINKAPAAGGDSTNVPVLVLNAGDTVPTGIAEGTVIVRKQ